MTDTATSIGATFANYADATARLGQDLGRLLPAFERAADAILTMPGRLIVAGMGKSGHVGRKLAATFASTGTPAHFVHPAEASHGDLGMIGRGDVVLMLSWSGETRELGDMIGYCKRFGVTTVALTGAAEGTLARRSDVAIVLPRLEEACPLSLAPTTSTLLQMAAGDALAIAVLEGRGFTAEGFRDFHPGGKLGAALLPVSDIMHAGDAVPLVGAGACVLDGVAEMSRRRLGIVGVTDSDGRLAGVFTEGDMRRYLEANIDGSMADVMKARTVGEVMTPGGVTIDPDRLAQTALALLQARRISAAFVVDAERRPIGLVTLLQLLGAGVA